MVGICRDNECLTGAVRVPQTRTVLDEHGVLSCLLVAHGRRARRLDMTK